MFEIHIRHGEASSEYNWGLTPLGQYQAQMAGEYIRQHIGENFTIGICSPSRRALETADALGFPAISWEQDSRLKEANWDGGSEPHEFTSWHDMLERVSAFCSDTASTYGAQNRIIVSHGGTLRMVRASQEHFTSETFGALFHEPYKYFTNCQMIIYTDTDPVTQQVSKDSRWVKSVCPWDEKQRFGHDWQLISSHKKAE